MPTSHPTGTSEPCKICGGPILPGEAYVPGSGRGLPVHARHPPVPSRLSDWPGAKAVVVRQPAHSDVRHVCPPNSAPRATGGTR